MKLEEYFVDRTKVEADGNKHKVVWARWKDRYEQRVKEQIHELLEQIEQADEEEEAEYGEWDLEEMGGHGRSDVNAECLKKKIDELNRTAKGRSKKRTLAER